MRKLLFAVVCFGLMLMPAFAGDSAVSTWNWTNSDGSYEGGWVVSFPTGSSDYFNERYDGVIGRPAMGVSVCATDFGSGTSYPVAGIYAANFSVDATGNTPDLSNATATTPPIPGGGSLYNCVYGSFGGQVAIASDPAHVVAQLPPGDSGLLGIGQDDNAGGADSGGWTQDGYTTPANGTGADFGLHINIQKGAELVYPNGGLAEYLDLADEKGDFLTVTVGAGDDYGVIFFGPQPGTLWMFFLSFLGLPIKKTTGVIPTLPDGAYSYLRGGTTWPLGFGGFTFNFVAVSGKPGVPGSVGISNEITLNTLADPSCNWGIRDDGTYEGGWVVSIPAGSSDYFNVDYNCLTNPGVTNILDYKLAVMDFGATATAYPTSGVFDTNFTVDPSGLTPDLNIGYGVGPFTYPGGTFASTSGLMITRTFATPIPYSNFVTDDIHGVIQFPPGDPGLLGVGGDTVNTNPNWYNGWTLNGYTTPSNDFSGTAGWGIRLGSN